MQKVEDSEFKPIEVLNSIECLASLLSRDSFTLDGVTHAQGFHPELVRFPALGIKGYIFPYKRVGSADGDVFSLWFMLLDFKAQLPWIYHFQDETREDQFQIIDGECDEPWPIRERHLTSRLKVLESRHPNPTTNAKLQRIKLTQARQFLQLGNIDPDDIRIFVGTVRIADPIFLEDLHPLGNP